MYMVVHTIESLEKLGKQDEHYIEYMSLTKQDCQTYLEKCLAHTIPNMGLENNIKYKQHNYILVENEFNRLHWLIQKFNGTGPVRIKTPETWFIKKYEQPNT